MGKTEPMECLENWINGKFSSQDSKCRKVTTHKCPHINVLNVEMEPRIGDGENWTNEKFKKLNQWKICFTVFFWPTPLDLTLDALGHRGLLIVYVLHLLSNSPKWSPLARNNRGTGSRLVTRPGVFEIPVAKWLEHSSSVGFTNAFITSPLQVLYTRRSGSTYHWALQTSWRGWADSKAVHSMECGGARSRYWRTLSQ